MNQAHNKSQAAGNYPDLQGKSIVVTGAAGGIGGAAVRQFIDQGAKVGCLDRDEAKLKALSTEFGDAVHCEVVDVSDHAQVTQAAANIAQRFGGIAGWINNVGYYSESPAIDLTLDEWNKCFTLNLSSAFIGSQVAARVMLPAGKGAIVNVTSNAGFRTSLRNPHYSAAKAGVAHLTRCLAAEWGSKGVRVNAVVPGYTNTPMIDFVRHDEAKLARLEKHIPLRRIGQPDDVARAMLFLCSDAAAYVTGVILPADGGLQIS